MCSVPNFRKGSSENQNPYGEDQRLQAYFLRIISEPYCFSGVKHHTEVFVAVSRKFSPVFSEMKTAQKICLDWAQGMANDKVDSKEGILASDQLNLKVLGQDGQVVQFKIKKNTPLRKLMSAYCDRCKLAQNTIRQALLLDTF